MNKTQITFIKNMIRTLPQTEHYRYWWHRSPNCQYMPPLYSFLTDQEWALLCNWYEATESLDCTAECDIPAMSMLQSLIMGNGLIRIVQCGHFTGYSTLLLGFMLRHMGVTRASTDASKGLISFDINDRATEFTEKWLRDAKLNDIALLITSNSSDEDLVPFSKHFFAGYDPQLVFIDSSHQFEHTLKELDLWYEALAPGGFLVLHDSSCYAGYYAGGHGGVFRALAEWSSKRQIPYFSLNGTFSAQGGLADYDRMFRALPYKDGRGLGLIQKPCSNH